jgi:hypothetical protein
VTTPRGGREETGTASANPVDDPHSLERKHYLAIRYLTQSRYDAISYLYNRLNIIDAKSSTLLNVNGLLMTATVFLAGALVHADAEHVALPGARFSLYWWVILGTAFTVLLLSASTGCCFWIFRLRFDHITAPGGGLGRPEAGDYTSLRVSDDALFDMLRDTKTQKYGAGSGVQPGERLDKERRENRTLAVYEETFFEITIDRQRWLRWAWFCSMGAGLIVMGTFLTFAISLLLAR